MKPVVGILMGSDSDLSVMQETAKVLKAFGIPCEIGVSSAHRSPKRTLRYAQAARERGIKVIVVGAGAAAHLGGVIAAETTLPVIGVPIDSSPLKGLDSLLATVQMPPGVPVATMAIGKAGATNAGVFAAEILATSDERIARKLSQYKEKLERAVAEKNERLGKLRE